MPRHLQARVANTESSVNTYSIYILQFCDYNNINTTFD